MNFYSLVLQNLINLPLMCFLAGIVMAILIPSIKTPQFLKKFLTCFVLFSIGLKGGIPLAEHATTESKTFITMLLALIGWALIHPFLSFYILKTFTKIDRASAAAIAACFGSISVITFITAVSFLDQLNMKYQGFVIAALSMMDIPAIISGLILAKDPQKDPLAPKTSLLDIIKKSLMNKAILSIAVGLGIGILLVKINLTSYGDVILGGFKPALSLFLFEMGLSVGLKRSQLKAFSWPLTLFGLYMPLIGGLFGIFLSKCIGLDIGTGTLFAVLCASASYIAVPAAMKIALPQAKEALYLPLSLTMAFPFNIILGIPLYYYLASIFLK